MTPLAYLDHLEALANASPQPAGCTCTYHVHFYRGVVGYDPDVHCPVHGQATADE